MSNVDSYKQLENLHIRMFGSDDLVDERLNYHLLPRRKFIRRANLKQYCQNIVRNTLAAYPEYRDKGQQ